MITVVKPETATLPTFYARRHFTDGCWWADSEQLPGWTAVADDEDELYRLVCESPAVYLDWPEGGYSVVLLWAERLGTIGTTGRAGVA